MVERPLPRSLSDLAFFFVLPTFLYLALFSCQGAESFQLPENYIVTILELFFSDSFLSVD